MRTLFVTLLFCSLVLPGAALAQNELVLDVQTIYKAQVTAVDDQQTITLPGTETTAQVQTLTAQVLSGPHKGMEVVFENDYTQLALGDKFYLRHITNSIDDTSLYSVADPDRLPVLAALLAIFVFLIFIFGGIQGVRGLASLCGSILLIFYLLLPGIYGGYSPILVSIGVASLIIVMGSYITHGFNKTTSAAVLGMLGTVCITGVAAYVAMDAANLSGFTSDESVYLNFDTGGTISMVGLLFGGIMIGLLGVLYDMAIGQAVAVEELFAAGSLTPAEVYRRAIRIGREHIGALVNTLAIAYVGAALPLLLLLQSSDKGMLFILNKEVFATEIVRILIGSIGLILAVPITTAIAAFVLVGKPRGTHAHKH